jgi:3-oxoacyl-(acyl-carrier-protein) synthase
MSLNSRVVVTGMAVNTPLGDTLENYLTALVSGRSAITGWTSFHADRIYSKIGGELANYDMTGKLDAIEKRREASTAFGLARRMLPKLPWSVGSAVTLALDALSDAGLSPGDIDAHHTAVVVGGHNLQNQYRLQNQHTFEDEPDFIDPLYAVHSHDTTHVGCVSAVLQARGTGILVGAACASGAYALKVAVDEVRYHDMRAAVVVCPPWDFSPIDMHAMALIGAISQNSFNDEPERASRPFDVRREGFVPAHGGAALIVESAGHAKARGARAYAEILAVETTSDGSYLPQPSEEGQTRAMQRALTNSGLAPEQIDYINGHFTSTPLGDVSEIKAIKNAFGRHAYHLKMNATKSMIGHTMYSSALVELVGAILQMRSGQLHPSINIDEIDSAIDLDVCANESVDWPVRYFMKNAFGFGGLNASIVVGHCDDIGIAE